MRQRLEQCAEIKGKYDLLYAIEHNGYQVSDDESDILDEDQQEVFFELVRAEPTVLEIFKVLDPRCEYLKQERTPWANSEAHIPVDRYNLERALALVADQVEWSVRLAPDAPSLVASDFHPWVWTAAQPLWEAGQARTAVHAASVAVTAHTQTKVGRRDVFDDDLMNQAFSTKDPEPGKPRLRLPGDHTDKTVYSRQRAIGPFAQGCYAGLRNPATHEHGPDWAEQRALQALASLSVLAGWIEECDVIHAPSTPGP